MPINTLCASNEYLGHRSSEHKHKCERCGTTWKHKGSDCRVSHEAFEEGHTCPNCGNFVELKHFTPEEEKEREGLIQLFELLELFGMLDIRNK